MRELGFTQNDFIVRVSDREAWIRFASEHGVQEQDIPAFLGIVDKFERDRPEECQRKLDAFHISRGDLVAFIENPPAGASERYDILMKDLTARGLDGYVKLDLSVVRGLAYYTGLVFEIFDTQRSLRAVAGGGRYDTLVGALSNNAVDMPATGFAMGDAVITHLIEQTPHARALKDARWPPQAATSSWFRHLKAAARKFLPSSPPSGTRDTVWTFPSRSPKSTDSSRRPSNPAPARP